MTDTKDDKSVAQAVHDKVMNAPEWVLLSRMRLFGFWPKSQGIPEDPPDEAKERTTLEQQRKQLLAQTFTGEAALQQALDVERKRRIVESRAKRAARIEARQKAAQERRLAWARERTKRIVFLGHGVSAGLEDVVSDAGKLLGRGLPVLNDGADVARALDISLPALRFLTFHRRGAALVHYHRFSIPKKTGGVRCISAPKARLKKAQQWLHDVVLARVADAASLGLDAHGFVPTRSVVTNALPHVGKHVVVNLDLKDFFPSITFRRVKGLFTALGYSPHVATIFALLSTEPPRVPVVVDGKRLHVALSDRVLPQGASTSPAITNLLCRRLDKRAAGLARRHGFSYTRYADDLTFSSAQNDDVKLKVLLSQVRRVIVDEGLVENADKTRIMRRGRRQEVTGVVVNQRPAVPRDEVRVLRAILHRAGFEGLAAQNRKQIPGDFVAHLRGRIAWVQMVDRKKGDALRATLDALIAKQ
ncbi:MAG: reverse transcriptase domain-containing protein [Deltaproteobacteria bacterium]|nr:reverse transcriptase domain-containing protein [Deltaproteobacteria bacterium]